MKKITFLLCLLVGSVGFAQENLEDFEGMPIFNPNNNVGAANVVADPLDAMNTVGEIISSAAGDPWQNADLLMQDNLMDLSSDITISVDVYSTTSFTMLARIDDLAQNVPAGTATADEDYVAGSGWQTLTFTFNEAIDGQGVANGQYSQIGFYPNWAGNNSGNNAVNNDWNDPTNFTVYVDNITAVRGLALPLPNCNDGMQNQDETGVDCGGAFCPVCPTPPTVAAPTPPNRSPQNVISLYSDAYNSITIESFDAPGFCGQGNTTEELIDGDATRTYTTANCVGWDFRNNRIDASAMDFVHFDYYTSDTDLIGKVFNVKFSDWAGGSGEVSAMEINTNDGTSPGVVTGTWVSVDLQINLANALIAGSVTRSDIAQFVITSNLANAWIDNVYFHNNNLSTDDLSRTNFKVFPNPTTNNWNVVSNSTINSIDVYDILGKKVATLTPGATEVEISSTNMNAGLYFAKIQSDNGSKTVKLIKE
jgi:hypothetical protein